MRNRIAWLVTILCLGGLGLNPSFSQEAENLLDNGDFETGDTTPWYLSGDATFEVVTELSGAAVPDDVLEGSNCLHVVVPTVPGNNWDTHLKHAPHTLEEGRTYTVSAFFKSAKGTLEIRMKPERDGDPWEAHGEKMITITEEWTEYSTTFAMADEVTPASLTWHLGFAVGEFWVDGVRFYEGDYVEPAFLNDIAASDPMPEDVATDVGSDHTVLSWTPDPLAGSRNVYLGETFADVNAADTSDTSGILKAQEQSDNTLQLDRLELGKTYYWRVDEVNATPDKTVFKGSVWSFTVEPTFYLIPGTNITATASSVGLADALPENTVNGAGLNADGQHGIDLASMWISSITDPNIW
ncbi:MAG: hypothetical protein GY809_12695, partial [Planctomycetes bacterium]|nr:hypothetical protein [Planctomycetota bacterium]